MRHMMMVVHLVKVKSEIIGKEKITEEEATEGEEEAT